MLGLVSCCSPSPSCFVLPCLAAGNTHLHCACSHPAVLRSSDHFPQHKNISYTQQRLPVHQWLLPDFTGPSKSVKGCSPFVAGHFLFLLLPFFFFFWGGKNPPFVRTAFWGPVSSCSITIRWSFRYPHGCLTKPNNIHWTDLKLKSVWVCECAKSASLACRCK